MDSLEIYSEMFPKIDREVIKLILQELHTDEILDALINISTDNGNPFNNYLSEIEKFIKEME